MRPTSRALFSTMLRATSPSAVAAPSCARLAAGRQLSRKIPASMAQRASASSTPPAPQRGVSYSSSAAAQQQSSSSSPAYPPPSLYKPPPHGQPLPRTHSHLLKSGELTSGIQAAEYEIRRSMLMSGLEDGAVVVCLGARMIYSSQNIFFKFRQATDFNYLTGFNEPDSALVLHKDGSARGYRMYLFCPIQTAEDELWHGGKAGISGAKEHFLADEAYPLSNLSTVLQRLLPLASAIHIDLPSPSPKAKRSFLASLLPTQGTMGELEAIVGKVPTSLMRPLAERVQRLRRIKSDAEVAIMRRAGEISSKAHAEVMHFASSSRSEADLEAHFQYVCSLEGSERPAYIPVVASGANALVIHYTRNDQRLQDGELVLIDAGCELHSYCSDITRTFPVSGTFTSAQRDLYEAVLTVNKRCIAMCEVPQRWSSNALHRHSLRIMAQELNQLGFDVNEHTVSDLYPHGLSHYLGMDLHDMPLMSKEEPRQRLNYRAWVYVPTDSRFPKHFHGIGIRIEDDICIRETGPPLVLTAHCPKEVVDVEAACRGTLRQ